MRCARARRASAASSRSTFSCPTRGPWRRRTASPRRSRSESARLCRTRPSSRTSSRSRIRPRMKTRDSTADMVDLGSVIGRGDGVLWGQACAEPQTLVEALVARPVDVHCFMGSSYSGIVKPGALRLASYCATGTNRALADAGALDILPVPYSQLGPLIRDGRIRCDVLLLQVSPPNARGEYSLGLAADYLVPALDICRSLVSEVNAQVPWTYTERLLARSDFDLVVETNRAPAVPPLRAPGELELAIARNALPFIP